MLEGVIITRLRPHDDHRGVFTEIFRASWPTCMDPLQWNVVTSRANVLRGFHVHIKHTDYLVALSGELVLGMKDMRRRSPSAGQTEMLSLLASRPVAVTVPPGVAHGFYFPVPSVHLYGVSHYWNTDDELGCRWDDPDIGLNWPTAAPLLSARDETAGSFAQMANRYHRAAVGEAMQAELCFA